MPTRLESRWTYDDYLLFPEDGRRHEIIDGEHLVTPSPNTRHQAVSRNLLFAIESFLRRSLIGEIYDAPFDVVLSESDVVQPDLLVVLKERSGIITDKNVRGAPDLVVEIISETTRRTDEIIKRKLYERHGVREYWIVDPELETAKVYRLAGEGFSPAKLLSLEAGDSFTSPLLPSLSIPLAEIFE